MRDVGPKAVATDCNAVNGGAITTSTAGLIGNVRSNSRTNETASDAVLFIFQLPTRRVVRTIMECVMMRWQRASSLFVLAGPRGPVTACLPVIRAPRHPPLK